MLGFDSAAQTVRFETVDKITLPKFYDLGAGLKPLVALDVSKSPGDETSYQIRVVIVADITVRRLLDDYPELRYCRKAGEDLIELHNSWFRFFSKENADKEENIENPIPLTRVVSQAQKFEHLLIEELAGESVFRVTQLGMYDTVSLIEQAEMDYPESVRRKLRKEVVTEVRECGKCLAFGVGTAAGFHALRAIELVMLDYWIVVCDPSPKPVRLDNWGACIKALREKADPDKPKPELADVAKVVAILRQLKDDDRSQRTAPCGVPKPRNAPRKGA